ncbi:N-acetyltransferase 8-like 2 isoform X2 [Alosa alosa]|nr:N-acetyltransferase 8-like 2 isoform X2 [Alosa alosa]
MLEGKKKSRDVELHVVIRRFRPSDGDAIRVLFRDGIEEHINPTFTHAMSQPLYMGLSLLLCVGGYLLGGWVLAACTGGAWLALVYYCSYELYAGYVKARLRTDMRDIQRSYLSDPDNSFFVAEAEVDGRSECMGMVAVAGKTEPGSGQRYGELFRMNVSSACRREGLGYRLAQTAIDFCKERGFSKVALETTSTQRAAVALYEKMGFTLTHTHTHSHTLTHTHTTTESPQWVTNLTRVTILRMEKPL